MGDNVQDISEVPFQNIEMGIPSIPDHIPTSWTPHPEDIQLYTAERARYTINRFTEQMMLTPQMRSFDYSNILPARGPIVAGISLTHRPRENFGPRLAFGQECKSLRPWCPTCSELDALAFSGMDAITRVDRERKETMVQHLRKRVQHCGYQAARADQLAYSWHREGNNASMMMHHFNMAHLEADRRRQLQPPIDRPPRVQAPPLSEPHQAPSEAPASTPAVTVTKITQQVIEQHVSTQDTSRSRSYRDVVQGGKRPASSPPDTDLRSKSLPPPRDMKAQNLTLLDPSYDINKGQQDPRDSLQTPRPQYSPITPSEVEDYIPPETPETPYLQNETLSGPQDTLTPGRHLSRLNTNTFESSNCETALEIATKMLNE